MDESGQVPPGGDIPQENGSPRPGDYSAPGLGEQGLAGTPTPHPAEETHPRHVPEHEAPPHQHYQGRHEANALGYSVTEPPQPTPPQPQQVSEGPPAARSKAWTAAVAIISGLLGALLVLALMPAIFGVNPRDLLTGKLEKASRAGVSDRASDNGASPSPTQGATDVSAIAPKISPSVVNINVKTGQASPFLPTGGEGTGSGVIYTQDGYIITNNHVVADAADIRVTLASGEEVKGKKVGADPENDIAVVKIDKKGLPAIVVGDSDSITVGELVVAVGSPLGFEQTVTAGIVSALHRVVGATGTTGQKNFLTDLIQTDASINPGNSGGALCDGEARLIGINAMIASTSGGSVGLGFAIPVNTAKKVADDLIAGRPVSHPYIGVAGQSVSPSIAKQYGLPVEEGAYITQVVPNGPAEKAGLKNSDIITAIDGKPIKTMDDVIGVVRSHKVGDKVKVTYYSDGAKKTATVTVAEKPSTVQQ